jgi:hypothetical protein
MVDPRGGADFRRTRQVEDVAATIDDRSTAALIRRSDSPPALLGCVAVQMNSATQCTISMLAAPLSFKPRGWVVRCLQTHNS